MCRLLRVAVLMLMLMLMEVDWIGLDLLKDDCGDCFRLR
jgi:hypothetical protein